MCNDQIIRGMLSAADVYTKQDNEEGQHWLAITVTVYPLSSPSCVNARLAVCSAISTYGPNDSVFYRLLRHSTRPPMHSILVEMSIAESRARPCGFSNPHKQKHPVRYTRAPWQGWLCTVHLPQRQDVLTLYVII